MGGWWRGVWSSVWRGGVWICTCLSQRWTEEGVHSVHQHHRLRKPALPLHHGYDLQFYMHIMLTLTSMFIVWSLCVQCLISLCPVSDLCVFSVWSLCVQCLISVFIVWSMCVQCLISVCPVSDICVFSVWSLCVQCLISVCSVSDLCLQCLISVCPVSDLCVS